MKALTNTLQRAYPSYTNKAIQTVGSDPTSAKKSGQDRPQTHRRPTPRVPAPQETYKPAQHHAEFAGSNVIEFVVDGREGIRLSDASEGNWVGLEGRDDRSLFEGDRLQIIFRLHVRHPIATPKKEAFDQRAVSNLLANIPF